MASRNPDRLNGSDTSFYREWVVPEFARVQCVWEQYVASSSSGHTQRVVPDGCADLITFSTGEAIVAGPTMRVAMVELRAGVRVRGVRLRPAALASGLGFPGADLRDRTLPLDALLPDRIARAVTDDLWAGRVPRGLPLRGAVDPRIVHAVRTALSTSHTTVESLADDLGMSPRHLHRLIVEHTGLTSTALRRVGRLQRFLALAHDRYSRVEVSETGLTGPAHLAHLAADAGYADHAHLSREVRRLTHATPTALLLEQRRP